jgi:hypothetical protein
MKNIFLPMFKSVVEGTKKINDSHYQTHLIEGRYHYTKNYELK